MTNLDKAILITRYVRPGSYDFFMNSNIMTDDEKAIYAKEYLITVLSEQKQWYPLNKVAMVDNAWVSRISEAVIMDMAGSLPSKIDDPILKKYQYVYR